MTDPEIILLMEKAKTEGLTIDEKTRLYMLTAFESNSQPKCRCFSQGEKCKIHTQYGRQRYPTSVEYES